MSLYNLELNVYPIKFFKKKKTLFSYRICYKEESNGEINEKALFRLVGIIVRYIRPKFKQFIIFQMGEKIISESGELYTIILNEIRDKSEEIPVSKLKIQNSETEIGLYPLKLNENEKEIAIRYIGQAITHNLRNRFDKFLVIEDYKNMAFKATQYDNPNKFGIIKLYKGIYYQISILEGQFVVIIDFISKFFSNETLRESLKETSYDKIERTLEVLCPLNMCQEHLKPFSKCRYSYPVSLGKTSSDDNELRQIKPSEYKEYDLIGHYHNEVNCPSNLIKLRSTIVDEKPLLIHSYYKDDAVEIYAYPLDLLQIIPLNEDAGEKTVALSNATKPPPTSRSDLIDEKVPYLHVLNDLDFPIILEERIQNQRNIKNFVVFQKPKYQIEDKYFRSIVYKKINNLIDRELKILIAVDGFIDGSIIRRQFDTFHRKFNVKIEYYIENLRNINNRWNDYDFCLFLLKDDNKGFNEKHLLGKKPFKEATISTFIEEDTGKMRNLFLDIYHKVFPPIWELVYETIYSKIIGLVIQYKNDKVISTCQVFSKGGIFISGIHLNRNIDDFIKLISEFLKKYTDKKILTMINGRIPNKLKEQFERFENIDFILVSGSSWVRFFKKLKAHVMDTGIEQGHAVKIGKEYHIITYKRISGTQKCLKIVNIFDYEDTLFEEIAIICFKWTKYHLSDIRNSSKQPFPIHSSQRVNNFLRNQRIKKLEFNQPLYFGGYPK